MTRIVFSDFDAFAEAVGGVTGRFAPTMRSTEEWWVQSVSTGRVLMQTFQIGSQAVFAGDGKCHEIAILIPLTAPTKIRLDGQLLEQNSIFLIKEGCPFTFSTSEATRWAAIVVPTDHGLLPPQFMESLKTRLFHKRARRASTLKRSTSAGFDFSSRGYLPRRTASGSTRPQLAAPKRQLSRLYRRHLTRAAKHSPATSAGRLFPEAKLSPEFWH